MKLDEFQKRFGGSLSETDHPNKLILGKGFPQEKVIRWCNDCRNMWPGEYKIDNELWKRVVPESKCFLCPSCLNNRVKASRGYGLEAIDFPEAPINQLFHFAHQLGRAEYANDQDPPRDSD